MLALNVFTFLLYTIHAVKRSFACPNARVRVSHIPVALAPFDAEFSPDGAVDLRLGFSRAQQSCDKADALVNFMLTAFAVSVSLAAPDDWLPYSFIHTLQIVRSHLKRFANLFGT